MIGKMLGHFHRITTENRFQQSPKMEDIHMRKIRAIVACMAALAVLAIVQSAAAPGKPKGVQKITEVTTSGPKADIVFTNGRIYTVNNKNPFAEAVAVKDG
jgi:hypothetical protein